MPKNRKAATRAMIAADTRLAGTKSIDAGLNFGDEIDNANYEKVINATKAALEAYNMSLAEADAKLNDFYEQEKKLRDWNDRMLSGVKTKFGADSDQYEMAGGVRKSERKRPVRKANPTT